MLKRSPFPLRITLELTNRCNYRCAMCPSRFDPNAVGGFMESSLFRRLADEAAEHLPVAVVPFFRGESLLHPDAPELVAYAKKRGLGPVQLANNASLMDEKTAKAFLDAGLDFVSFSLDTIRPEEYGEIRKGGDLEKVHQNVFGFIEQRDKGGYATEVQVSATRTGLNEDGIQEFVEFWRGKADRVRIYYEHSADGHPGSLDCPELAGIAPRRACKKPFEDMIIYHDGKVALCNHDWFRDPPLGDAAKDGIQAVWDGQSYQDIREQHLEPDTLTDPTCLHCDHWKMYYYPKGFIGELYTKDGSGQNG